MSTTDKNQRKQIVFYTITIFIYWASLYFFVPTLSVYTEEVTHDLSIVGTVISMYGLWQAVARYPLGIISDSVGRRKPFIIGGLLLGGVGAFVMMNAQGALGLIIGRGITGLAAATWVLLMVGFSSLFPPRTSRKSQRNPDDYQCCWPDDRYRHQWNPECPWRLFTGF